MAVNWGKYIRGLKGFWGGGPEGGGSGDSGGDDGQKDAGL